MKNRDAQDEPSLLLPFCPLVPPLVLVMVWAVRWRLEQAMKAVFFAARRLELEVVA